MSGLKVTYNRQINEPILEGSHLVIPDSMAWHYIECNNTHIVVKFDKINTLPSGQSPFLKWIFYARVNGVWAEVEWNSLTEEHKMAIFDEIVEQPEWLPFYEQDVLPPWENAWFILAALGQS